MISPKPFFVRMIIPSSYVVVIVTDAKVVSVIIYSLNNVLRFTYVSHTHWFIDNFPDKTWVSQLHL